MKYTVERRMLTVKTGWFKKQRKPMWCLVERGTWTDNWLDDHDYSIVILSSEDKSYIDQEFLNFNGDCK